MPKPTSRPPLKFQLRPLPAPLLGWRLRFLLHHRRSSLQDRQSVAAQNPLPHQPCSRRCETTMSSSSPLPTPPPPPTHTHPPTHLQMRGLRRRVTLPRIRHRPTPPPTKIHAERSLTFKRWVRCRCFCCLARDHQVRPYKDFFRCHRPGHSKRQCRFSFPTVAPSYRQPPIQACHSAYSHLGGCCGDVSTKWAMWSVAGFDYEQHE
ncbi:hypothetical protein SEVIR_3G109350v4 [Setaria viridis]